LNEQNRDAARLKIQKVFSYIRELTKLRTPPLAKVSSYDWSLRFSSLPTYPSIQTAQLADESSEGFDGIILRIKRPLETSCPQPPTILTDWLETGWEQVSADALFLKHRNRKDDTDHTVTESFTDNPDRPRAFEDWVNKRSLWQEAELPVREATKIFSEFFKLHGQLQRESEKYQLYLGDGNLVWESAIEQVDHPILLKKLELEFDSSVPEFILRESDDGSELYTTLLRHHELDGGAILACKTRLDEADPHPLANGKTTEFLKFFIQRFFQDGKYYESKTDINQSNPAIYRDPIIFLGSRTQGFTEALDRLIDALPTSEFIPEALLRVVGIDEKLAPSSDSPISTQDSSSQSGKTDIDFLLTKPANKEQERVITRLEQTGSVLVQGPPGTGKSHTIANIIGHLLASGKTVLVSSHTSKALKVVREKVVKPLQPLCVSVLENDLESKSQLEESINGIVSYLSRTDEQSLTKEVDQLGARRSQINLQIEKLAAKALNIRKSEYADIIVSGEGTPPSEAARKVLELEEQHGWIPGPLNYGAPLPLSEAELGELYATNKALSTQDEACHGEGLPDLEEAILPSEFKELVASLQSIDRGYASKFSELWGSHNQSLKNLEEISHGLEKALEIFSAHKWIKKVVEDSRLGKERVQPWFNLMEIVESTNKEIAKRSEIILRFGPQVNLDISSEAIKSCDEIVMHLRSGKSLGFFSTAFKTQWKTLIAACKVDDGTPSTTNHFESILALMETNQMRRELKRRWERQVVLIGGPKLESSEPEIFAKSLLDALKLATSWTTTTWNSLEESLSKQDFMFKTATEKLAINGQSQGYIEQIQNLVESILIPSIEARKTWIRLRELEQKKEQAQQVLRVNLGRVSNANDYLNEMAAALEELSPDIYKKTFERYLDLKSKSQIFVRRNCLLEELSKTASGWAKAISLRADVHGSDNIPGNPFTAWNVSQWRQELDSRLSQDYSAAQRDLQRLKTELNGVNAQYVEKLAWRFQHSRTGLREKQALTGWQQLQSKITKSGRGVRDVHVKREARKTLKDCKNAVPVWIMPLSRVFDSFDLVQTKFDVIILDEASQSDISALVAFSIAKQVIVVGDNEQVTPYAVGQRLEKVQSLIDELLQGIPNRMLYDGKTSVYDLAEQAFGETIRLVEHFRCVPDIIEFSNRLSYSGEIRPLRESSSSPFSKHLIAHRVESASSQNKTNQKEATEVASIVAAMIETPEYRNASIGIISMVGQEQALVIDGILQRRLKTDEYSRHKLLCGNASQFQGDERDVMLLSMVDTCDTPPLPIRQTEDFKKTFNVAASRAKNQLWVVHSLNPSTDLKPGDLRLRLIQHAENPRSLRKEIEATQKKADPKSVVFEPMVIKDLMQHGFRITPQFEVGAYTIDMVIEGANKRIALECDGDRYHPPEKLADDIQRQMVLERLGWTFIRIRGSEYFRHRETTIRRVVAELEALGIEKLGPLSQETAKEDFDELQRKVLQRAYDIRQAWEATPEVEIEVKAKRGRWGKKSSEPQPAAFNGNAAVKVEPLPSESGPYKESVSERLQRQYTSPDHRVDMKIDQVDSLKKFDPSQIVAELRNSGFEVIDKRPVGGSLWVIDDPRFKDTLTVLGAMGYQFIFAPNGSGSTKDRPAWYTKRK
jgi:Superfamily I DNA and RNA helicases and helicase subunits